MEPLTEKQIRGSFANCSKGEANRLKLPLDFAELPWPELDFLGWRDPGAPLRGHLVIPGTDGSPVGITLRTPDKSRTSALKSSICQFCLTGHASSGVALFAAPRAGEPGRQGNTVGIYACADLACSLYVRGRRQPALRPRYEETLTVDEKIDRMLGNVHAFAAKVLA
ncbi:FBP domain-containing protein [Streptomyces purpureus]|uniref:FBP domain-containing protein n=1 Tax=Streptomyces purpureus TaxID=1951 RepID=UPI000364A0B0|nr:FBP domain-containing protein [Streptomyces purpureus]